MKHWECDSYHNPLHMLPYSIYMSGRQRVSVIVEENINACGDTFSLLEQTKNPDSLSISFSLLPHVSSLGT